MTHPNNINYVAMLAPPRPTRDALLLLKTCARREMESPERRTPEGEMFRTAEVWLSRLVDYHLSPGGVRTVREPWHLFVLGLNWDALLTGVDEEWPDVLIGDTLLGDFTVEQARAIHSQPEESAAYEVLLAFRLPIRRRRPSRRH